MRVQIAPHEGPLEASKSITTIEHRQGLKIAFEMGFVSAGELAVTVQAMPNSAYRSYVESILAEGVPGL